MTKEDFINVINKYISKPYKIRFIKNGKYGEECWIYQVNNEKRQKINSKGQFLIDKNNNPVMESTTGLLITKETIENEQYLEEYLKNCF